VQLGEAGEGQPDGNLAPVHDLLHRERHLAGPGDDGGGPRAHAVQQSCVEGAGGNQVLVTCVLSRWKKIE
jgi:hypothetical protein